MVVVQYDGSHIFSEAIDMPQTDVLCIRVVTRISWNDYALCLKHNLQPPIIQEKLRSPQFRQQGQSCREDRACNMLSKVWILVTPHATHQ
mmetsp:Transcript_89802/g.214668  ORF Transcript_89802/g.214668 Transcript_89802/m.214668 type:complete len:90 (+) Transcript_89802:332-601(+)